MSKKNEKPQCIPLCYPDNYKWDKVKGKLVEKKKSRGLLVVCEDALEIIRSIDGPICPVAITGPARCGKSYIASQLIEPRTDKCVFETSAKMKPQTMGIWMSTHVFKKTLSNGTEVTVIILDTEGLDAYSAHKEDDMLMFALMALMSSVLVYNNKGSVNAEDINKLSWISKLNKVFRWSGDGQKATTLLENEFIKFFPNFMWLLRDVTMSFTLTRDDEDVEVDFKNYLLEEVLKLEKESIMTEAKVKEANATRRALLKSFPVFDALTLPMPSLDQSVLKDMDKGKNRGRLNQTFLKEVDVFISHCGTLMKPKKAWPYVGNINGHQFTKMLQQYVSGFSKTKSISVDAVVTSVIDALLQEVVGLVFADYCIAMDEYAKTALPCQNYEIINKHNNCLFKSMRKFKEKSKYVNDVGCLEKYRNVLKERMVQYSDDGAIVIGGYLHTILKKNEKESDTFCKQLVDELLVENVKPGKSYRRQSSYGSSVDFINEQYKERARGPQIWHVYKTVLAAKIEEMSRGISTIKEDGGVKSKTKFDPNKNLIENVAEEEEREREKLKEQMIALKEEEEKTIRAMVDEDIVDEQKQSEADFQERSAATKVQVETLKRTHKDLAKELQLTVDKMGQENKKREEELIRKRENMMRQS